MSRRLRRNIEKVLRKNKADEIYSATQRSIKNASDRVEAKLLKEQQEARIDEDAVNSSMAMYYLFGIHMHRIYGFGQERLLRLFAAVDKSLGEWKDSGERKSLDSLREELKQEVDIDIDFGNWKHSG